MRQHCWILALTLGALIASGDCCFGGDSGGGGKAKGSEAAPKATGDNSGGSSDNGGGNSNTGSGNTGGGNNGGGSDTLKAKLGIDAKDVTGYDGSKYEGHKGTPVANSGELSCSFEAPCCWGNEDKADQLDWLQSNAAPNSDTFAANFNAPPPSDTYLMTIGNKANGDNAQFVSCQIGCAASDILVTLEHYSTPNVKLQVCERPAGDPSTLKNCVDVPKAESPGPSLLSLAADQNIEVVIVASNLIADDGDVAIIDNIVVDYAACTDGQTPAPSGSTPASGGGATTAAPGGASSGTPSPNSGSSNGGDSDPVLCALATCTFDDGSACSYKSGSDLPPDEIPAAWKEPGKEIVGFEPAQGSYGNPVTGVFAEPSRHYLARTLQPGQGAAIILDGVQVNQDRVISVDFWDATLNSDAFICIDHLTNCPYTTADAPDFNQLRSWRTGKAIVPAGTKRVIIAAKSKDTAQGEGTIGIDNIKMLRPAGGGAATASKIDAATEDVCVPSKI